MSDAYALRIVSAIAVLMQSPHEQPLSFEMSGKVCLVDKRVDTWIYDAGRSSSVRRYSMMRGFSLSTVSSTSGPKRVASIVTFS